MVPDITLPHESTSSSSSHSFNSPTVAYTTVVPSSSRTSGGLPSNDSATTRPSFNTPGSGVYNATGRAPTNCMARLRESHSSRGLSLQTSLLPNGETKTNSNYGSSFSKWASWCQQWNRDPLSGPIEDVANFLADLYAKGYQYHSLNACRSAISSTHEMVDGVSVWNHSMITRLLKGVFHSRPPQPRYSSFWNVGSMIDYLRKLGSNDSLTLKQLTMKMAMLLALTRPSHSADFSRLDLKTRLYKLNEVIFKPTHLAKQSKSCRPVADFFLPSFPEDSIVCPMVTLMAYEDRTVSFRSSTTGGFNSTLFLSYVGLFPAVLLPDGLRQLWRKLG